MSELTRHAAGAVVLLALMLSACEEDVAAVLPTAYPFEAYGVLDATADTQVVRVFPITDRLEPSREASIDATVTTTDLVSGHERVWQDSLVTYADGTHGYLFWHAFRPEGNHTYRLEVVRSDGERSHAQVTVPGAPVLLEPRTTSDGVVQPVRIEGRGAQVLMFEVTFAISSGWCADSEFSSYTYSYRDQMYAAGDGMQVEILLEQNYSAMLSDLLRKGAYDVRHGVVLHLLRLQTRVADAGWMPPDGVFDPEVLIEPGTMSNVENGFGFIGSGYVYDAELQPSDATLSEEALQEAGFALAAPPPPEDPGCFDNPHM